MSVRQQHCDYCGDDLGVFAWSRRWDGPLDCGAPDCAREASADAKESAEMQAREDAEADGFRRYMP